MRNVFLKVPNKYVAIESRLVRVVFVSKVQTLLMCIRNDTHD